MLIHLSDAYIFDRDRNPEKAASLTLSPEVREKMESYLRRDRGFISPADDFKLAEKFVASFWRLGLSPSTDPEAFDLLIDIAPADAVNKLSVSFRDSANLEYIPLIEKAVITAEQKYGALIAVKLILRAWNQLPHEYQSNNNPYEEKLGELISRFADDALEIDTVEASYALLNNIRHDVPSLLKAQLAQKCLAPLKRAGNADPIMRYSLRTEALDQSVDACEDILNDNAYQAALKDWLEDYHIDFIDMNTSDESLGGMRSEKARCLDSYRILFCRLSNYAAEPLIPLLRRRLEEILTFTEIQASPQGVNNLSKLFHQQAGMVHDVRIVRDLPALDRPAETAMIQIFQKFGVPFEP